MTAAGPHLGPSGHEDTFSRDRLPPMEQWPDLRLEGLDYPDRLNAAVEMTDRMVAKGFGDSIALIGNGPGAPQGTLRWTTGSPAPSSRISPEKLASAC